MKKDVCIKSGSYCPVCKGVVGMDCWHNSKQFQTSSLAQPRPQQKEGYVLVPIDATEAMVNAFIRIDLINDGDLEGTAHNIWNTMIQAAKGQA